VEYRRCVFKCMPPTPTSSSPCSAFATRKVACGSLTPFDRFLDHYGVLDAEYEAAADAGVGFWVLHSDRAVTPWAGRYLVVIDSGVKARPAWSPLPRRELRARMQGNADTAD